MPAAARKPLSSIRSERLELWDGCLIGHAHIMRDDGPMPEVIMVDGRPFVPDAELGPRAYRRASIYRITLERD